MHELKRKWHDLRQAQPRLRIRDAARHLNVAEAALLETRLGEGVQRLSDNPERLFHALPRLGIVMSLMRNEAAVHEKDIAFTKGRMHSGLMSFSGDGWAVQVAPGAIAHAFHVDDPGANGLLRSIQLFDAAGHALWKIYARDKADHSAFTHLLGELAPRGSESASAFVSPLPPGAEPETGPAQSSPDLAHLLGTVASEGIPIMVDVANAALRQWHIGPIHRIARMGNWLNILDPGFDFHLNEAEIAVTIVEDDRIILRRPDGGAATMLSCAPQADDRHASVWQALVARHTGHD